MKPFPPARLLCLGACLLLTLGCASIQSAQRPRGSPTPDAAELCSAAGSGTPIAALAIDGAPVKPQRSGRLPDALLIPGEHQLTIQARDGLHAGEGVLSFEAEPGHTYRFQPTFKGPQFQVSLLDVTNPRTAAVAVATTTMKTRPRPRPQPGLASRATPGPAPRGSGPSVP